jgi:membrane protease YdiL (CAAX protease family)
MSDQTQGQTQGGDGPAWPPPAPGQQPSYPAPGYPAPGYGYGQPTAYAAPPAYPVYPAFPHAEPQPYHQMLRTWSYAWWKPVVGIVLLILGFFLVAPLALLPIVLIGVIPQDGDYLDNLMGALSFETIEPVSLLYLNLTLGSIILVTWGIERFVHRLRPRWLSSVVPKLRWRFLGVCMGLSVVALVAQVVVGQLVPGDTEADLSGAVNDFTGTTLVLAVIVVLTTPLQAAGEEYAFRGYLTQAVGSLTRSAWFAVLVPALIFAIVHGAQNVPLFFDRFMFGVIAGWLVIRTGGLEAGIALHVLNNLLAFGFALTFGDISESLMVSEVSWWNIPLTLTQSGVYAALVILVARRMGLQTRTRPPVEAQQAAAGALPV